MHESLRKYWVDPIAAEIGVKFQVAEIHGVKVRRKDGKLDHAKRLTFERMRATDVDADPILGGYRALFRTIGVTDAVASPEALLRLIQSRGKLPDINTVVDAYNYRSVERLIVASAHDLSRIRGDVRIAMTTGEEVFQPLGAVVGEPLRKGEWAGLDDGHVLCRLNCRQSDLSKVTTETTDLLVYVQGNRVTSDSYLEQSLADVCEAIVAHNGGQTSFLAAK